jgi:hypothetical protein
MSLALTYDDSPSYRAYPVNTGRSDDSNKLKEIFVDLLDHFGEPVSVGWPIGEMLDSLSDTYDECSHPNWDGYDALPLTENAYEEARRFIQLLPTTIQHPEIVPEPSGEIGFEWRKGRRRIFAISIDGRNKLTYAGIFGSNKTHGTEYFGDTLPSVIIDNLKRIYI